jgi:hypothetical protein
MRSITEEPALRGRLVEAGLASMRAQPSLADTGAHIAKLLSLRANTAAVAGSATP